MGLLGNPHETWTNLQARSAGNAGLILQGTESQLLTDQRSISFAMPYFETSCSASASLLYLASEDSCLAAAALLVARQLK